MSEGVTFETDVEKRMADFQNALKYRLELGGNKASILRKQFGLLCRTLIKITFPHDLDKSKKRVTDRVNSKFHQMSEEQAQKLYGASAKEGHGAVRWTGASTFALYGVAKDVDFTDASVDQLQSLYLGRAGNANRTSARAKYARGHGKQDVYVWQKITTKKKTVLELIKMLTGHFGRLKAGWLPAWREAGSPNGSIGPVAGWILKHEPGARGDVRNNLTDEEPSMTAINRAKGAGSIKENNLLAAALRIRAQALVRDVQFAIQNPSKWKEREAASEAEE